MATVTADSYGIDATGGTDVSSALGAAINAQPAGTIFELHADGSYKSDSAKVWSNPNGIIIEGQNAALFESVRRGAYPAAAKTLSITGANMTVQNLRMYGFRKDAYTGDKLTTVAGTPTVVSTTVQLAALNDEVRLPKVGLDWDIAAPYLAQYMNFHTPYYFRDKDGYVRFEFSASATTPVTNDVVFAIVDDDTNAVLTSQTFTMTTSLATYQLAWLLPNANLGTRLRVTLRKATATASTITIASITATGEAGYRPYTATGFQGGDEFSHHFVPAGSGQILQNCYSEGPDGDGFNMSTNTDGQILNCVTRGCGRQGVVMQRNTRTIVDDLLAREVGRTGIDLEPNVSTDFVTDAIIRNCTFRNCRNFPISSGVVGNVINLNISNIDSVGAGMGAWAGGAQGATFVNYNHSGTFRLNADRVLNGGKDGADALFYSNGLECDGFTTDIGIYLLNKSGAQNMHIREARVLNTNGLLPRPLLTADSGHAWTQNWRAWATSAGKALLLSGSLGAVTVDYGADFDMSVDITVGATHACGLVFRLQDADNNLFFNLTGTGLALVHKRVAGVNTQIGASPYTVANYNSSTVTARVHALGSTLDFYLAGVHVATITETTHLTNTKHGLWSNSDIVARFDNFAIVAP